MSEFLLVIRISSRMWLTVDIYILSIDTTGDLFAPRLTGVQTPAEFHPVSPRGISIKPSRSALKCHYKHFNRSHSTKRLRQIYSFSIIERIIDFYGPIENTFLLIREDCVDYIILSRSKIKFHETKNKALSLIFRSFVVSARVDPGCKLKAVVAPPVGPGEKSACPEYSRTQIQ